MASRRIDRPDVGLRRGVVGQDLHQATGAYRRPENEIRFIDDARALHRRRHQHVAAVAGQIAVDAQGLFAPLAVDETPLRLRGGGGVEKAIVVGQFGRRFRRAMTLEVVRRRAGDEFGLAEFFRHQILRADLADAHRQIDALFHQIDNALGQRHVDLHVRMQQQEFCDGRRQMTRAEVVRTGDLQRAARRTRRLRHELFGIIEIRQQLHAALEKGLSRFGQAESPRGAIEQARTQMRLEVGHVTRTRRGGYPESFRGLGEAAVLHHPYKHLHG